MTIETLLLPLLSGAIGWALRHYGVLAPAVQAPQSRPAAGGTVPLGPAQADLPSMIASVVGVEIKKGIAYLESRLFPAAPVSPPPQPTA